MSTKVILKDVRISFPHVFEPSPKSDKFDVTALIEQDDKKNLKAIRDGIIEAIAQGPAKIAQKFGNEKIRWKGSCFKTQEDDLVDIKKVGGIVGESEGKFREEYEGVYLAKASNSTRPRVVDQNRDPLDSTDGKPYSGCYCTVVLGIWIQDNEHGCRINAELRGIQFKKDGDAFAGGGVAEDDDFDEAFEDDEL